MNNDVKVTDSQSQHSKSHGIGHMKMMILCCGLPIAAVLAISVFGLQIDGWETLLFLACPIGMGVMMFMMRKKGHPPQASTETAQNLQGSVQMEEAGGPNEGYLSLKEQKEKHDLEATKKRKNDNHSCCHF